MKKKKSGFEIGRLNKTFTTHFGIHLVSGFISSFIIGLIVGLITSFITGLPHAFTTCLVGILICGMPATLVVGLITWFNP